jgi:DNA-directed RNA polymerase specialized sigma24 family protein
MSDQMTDEELLLWLSEHGTDISQEELAREFPRVVAATGCRPDASKPGTSDRVWNQQWSTPIRCSTPDRAAQQVPAVAASNESSCELMGDRVRQPSDKPATRTVFISYCPADAERLQRSLERALMCRPVLFDSLLKDVGGPTCVVLLNLSDRHMFKAPAWDVEHCLATKTPTQMPADEHLILRTRQVEPVDCEELLRRHCYRALKAATFYARDLSLAQTVVRDAFRAVLNEASQLEGPESFSRSLYSTVVERGRLVWRSRECMPNSDWGQCLDAWSTPTKPVVRNVASAVEQLSEPLREVVYLYDTGFEDQEIADVLSTPVRTIRRRRSSAFKQLREMLAA